VINELARQFGESTQQFMLLTNSGLSILSKRRAVDYLKAVLEELQSGGSVQPIIEFRDRCVFTSLLVVDSDLFLSQLWAGSDLCYAPWPRERQYILGRRRFTNRSCCTCYRRDCRCR
jgi:hypothetical protein